MQAEDSSASEVNAALEPVTSAQAPQADNKASSAKKKKKAKQKQRKSSAQAANSTSIGAAGQQGKKQQQQPASPAEEDIDQLLASLNISQAAATAETSTSGRSNVVSKGISNGLALLGVNPAKLRADDEMRRIFGSKVVDAARNEQNAGGMVGGSRRVRRYCEINILLFATSPSNL